MQVNRLSSGLQEQLKSATNFNTARSETLFDKGKYGSGKDGNVDFSTLNTDDLNITGDQIGGLLDGFADEVINVFSGMIPDFAGDNPLKGNDPTNPEQKPVFTA